MGLFGPPKCPVDAETRRWVADNMLWLAEQFGESETKRREVVTPTREFFPYQLSHNYESLRALLDRICGFMTVAPERIELKIYENGNIVNSVDGLEVQTTGRGAAGFYQFDETKEVIAIDVTDLGDITNVVATIAHELAHARLLGEYRVSPEDEDHEDLTDLATVVLGMGIFPANSVVSDSQWSNSGWSGWSVKAQGYLDEPTFAFALAWFADYRGEAKPKWMRCLNPTVKALMKQSLRYLRHTAGSESLMSQPEGQ